MAPSTRRLGRSPARRSAVMELAELQQRYLVHHGALGHSAKTIRHYRDTFKAFDRFLAGQGYAASTAVFTTATMQEFALWLRETPTRGWRGETKRQEAGIHGTLVDLRAFCHWLVEEDVLAKTPKVPVPKLAPVFFPVLTDDDLDTIFATKQLSPQTEIGTRNRALIAFMLDTGVRRSELVNLMLASVNLTVGEARVIGKGGKERSVFFAPATIELLRRWVAIRGDRPGSLFWLSFEGVKMLFTRIQREAGLAVFHPHQLRHTCATKLLANGTDTHSVRRMLGHASVTTTERYLSMSTQDLKAKHDAASPYEGVNNRLGPEHPSGKRRLRSH